jgi:hypothetical protein
VRGKEKRVLEPKRKENSKAPPFVPKLRDKGWATLMSKAKAKKVPKNLRVCHPPVSGLDRQASGEDSFRDA